VKFILGTVRILERNLFPTEFPDIRVLTTVRKHKLVIFTFLLLL